MLSFPIETGTSDQPPAWHDAIQGKVHIYGSDVDDYLRTFVPSQTPCNVSPPSIKLVEDWNPHKGKEKEVCDSLVRLAWAHWQCMTVLLTNAHW